jgi:hypothetical protein
MSIIMLRGRPEERYKLAIGLLTGAIIALPVNALNLLNWQYPPELGYLLIAIVLSGIVFYKRTFVVGTSATIVLISLPQAIAALLPTQLTSWHVSAGVLWLLALFILGCLTLMREAQTRTDADIDVYWLFRPQK